MTQPPTTPEGTPEPAAEPTPTFGSTPPPASSPYAAPGASPYAAPGASPYAAPASDNGRKKKLRIFGGIGAVAVIILVKIIISLGIGEAAHKVEHRADDAEKVVMTALQADTAPEFDKNFAAGVQPKDAIDPGCQDAFGGEGSQFTIPKSRKNEDGSADITVDFKETDASIHFHLVEQSGAWKIDKITCS